MEAAAHSLEISPVSGMVKSNREYNSSFGFESRERGASGDQPRGTLVGHIGPGPFDQHQHAVAESDQVQDVDEYPEEPGEEAGEVQSAEVGDRGGATNGRQVSLVQIDEEIGRAHV